MIGGLGVGEYPLVMLGRAAGTATTLTPKLRPPTPNPQPLIPEPGTASLVRHDGSLGKFLD